MSSSALEEEIDDEIEMPTVGSIPAGNLGDAIEVVGKIRTSRKHAGPGHVIAKIQGNSLFPYLKQGDEVTLRPEGQPNDRKIIVAQAKDLTVTCKELRLDPKSGTPLIFPMNPDEALQEEKDWKAILLVIGLRRYVDNVPIDVCVHSGLTAKLIRAMPLGLED